MEVAHADLPKITWVVLVEIRPVVMLAACHAAPTRVLAMLADATMTGRNMAAALEEKTLAVVLKDRK